MLINKLIERAFVLATFLTPALYSQPSFPPVFYGTTEPAICDPRNSRLFRNITSNITEYCSSPNTWSALAGSTGVSSLNSLTGALSITAGTGINVNAASPNIQVVNSGVLSLNTLTGALSLVAGASNILTVSSVGSTITIEFGPNTAWSSYTPTVSVITGAGSISGTSIKIANYLKIGKTVFVRVSFTTVVTGIVTAIGCTLPYNTLDIYEMFAGIAQGTSSDAPANVTMNTISQVALYLTAPNVSSFNLATGTYEFQGVYESQ